MLLKELTKHYLCGIVLVSALFTLACSGGPSSNDATPPVDPSAPKWTVMFYMDGDNSLGDGNNYNFIAKEMRELQDLGSDAHVNLVALWDGLNDDRHGYYHIAQGKTTLLRDTGEVDMGNPNTARDFIDFAAQNYPADKYIFVFRNHGIGPDRSKGICQDDTSHSFLSEVDQKSIMAHAVARLGKKFEVVSLDACLMGAAEVFYQYRDAANYLIASESLTLSSNSTHSWSHFAVSAIKANPNLNGDTITKAIVESYASEANNYHFADTAVSAANLAYATEFADTLNRFCQSAMASGATGTRFAALANGLPSFGETNHGVTKDLGAFMDAIVNASEMPQLVKDRATELKTCITNRLIIINKSNPSWSERAFGCAITMKSVTNLYRSLDLCANTQWDEFCTFADFPNA